MGLFTPDERERAEELAGQASARPGAVADAVVEERLHAADDAPARVYAARALADAAEADPGAVLSHADVLRGLHDEEADVRSHARRGLSALADHCRERGAAALDRAAARLDERDPAGAEAALADARSRFARAESLFERAAGDPVLTETLGVGTVGEAGDDRFAPLVRAGSDLPAEAEWTFTTGRDDQQALEMTVLRAPGTVERERARAPDDEPLATLRLRGLPPAPAGVPVLEVHVEVDAEGAVTATLRDRATGKAVSERAGTVAREGGPDADSSLPPALAERLDTLAERVDAVEPVEEGGDAGGEPAVDDQEPATADDEDDAATDQGDATDGDSVPAGPGKGRVARGRADRGAADTRSGPDERAIERVLAARDDLQRAARADTDDPAVIRDGVAMTVRNLADAGEEGPVAAAREALASVLDADADDAAALRERAAAAVEAVDAALADADVAVVDPDPGDPVDTDRHRVVETVPDDRPAGRVVAVEGAGFAVDGTVRRPARVRVSDGAGRGGAPGETE